MGLQQQQRSADAVHRRAQRTTVPPVLRVFLTTGGKKMAKQEKHLDKLSVAVIFFLVKKAVSVFGLRCKWRWQIYMVSPRHSRQNTATLSPMAQQA